MAYRGRTRSSTGEVAGNVEETRDALAAAITERTVAFLMAFGGGALLAALTLDLVGSALALGHFPALAIGCVLGGLLFIGLNHVVNDW